MTSRGYEFLVLKHVWILLGHIEANLVHLQDQIEDPHPLVKFSFGAYRKREISLD